jgi:ABC-2 type transport system permease protein
MLDNTLTIAGRQFRGYFNGPVAYIVICIVLIALGFFFWTPFFLMNHASVREMFRLLGIMLAFAVPAITMGLLAEERRSGTIELLITMPVREAEVIFGKFLAAVGLLAVLLACTLPYPISVSMLGNLDWGPVLTGYLGLFLQAATMAAIGLACSAFTENQLVAFFVGVALCLPLAWLFGAFLPFVPTGFLTTLFEFMSFDRHTEALTRGVIDTRDLVYFFSIAGFALMVAFRALESRRWS